VKDHRLRVLFPSYLKTEAYQANMPFDVVTRNIGKVSDPAWTEQHELTDPQQGFICLSDTQNGLSLLNKGTYEAEITSGNEKSIALTLLRSFYQYGNWDTNRWPEEDFQNPGEHTFNYSIYPYTKDWETGGVFAQFVAHNTPIVLAQVGVKKGSELLNKSFISLSNPNIQLSAIKKHEYSNDLVLRLYNPGENMQEGSLKLSFHASEVKLLNLEELPIGDLELKGQSISLKIPHHKIYTLLIKR